MTFASSGKPLLLANAKLVAFGPGMPSGNSDVLVEVNVAIRSGLVERLAGLEALRVVGL